MLIFFIFVCVLLHLARFIVAIKYFVEVSQLKKRYQNRWIIYLIGCDVTEESGLVRTKIQQAGEKEHEVKEGIHGWDLAVLTCGKGDRNWVCPNAMDEFQLWSPLSFAFKNICCVHTAVLYIPELRHLV